jgi:hypothetical protein
LSKHTLSGNIHNKSEETYPVVAFLTTVGQTYEEAINLKKGHGAIKF